MASSEGYTDIVDTLIENGLDPNLPTKVPASVIILSLSLYYSLQLERADIIKYSYTFV